MHYKENTAGNMLDNFIDTISDAVPKNKAGKFFEDGNPAFSRNKVDKLFGRQNSVHQVFGGGKSADLLLWRNKKISSSVLGGATLIWAFFEWLDYHLLSILCLALIVGMIVQFSWSNASSMMNRSQSEIPRLVLPKELFVNVAVSVGAQVNQFLGFIQDVAVGRNLKQFAMVVLGLLAAALIGSWCNLLTVIYVGFVAAHTLPVLYEKYEDQVDDFMYSLFGQIQSQYRKLDSGLLSKIPKGNLKSKKAD